VILLKIVTTLQTDKYSPLLFSIQFKREGLEVS